MEELQDIKLNIPKQAVILAGGRGERLRPLTDMFPKPMVPVNGVPFLDYLINSIFHAGIERILLLLGYKSNMIINRYGNSIKDKVQIEYSLGTVDDLTGRRLLNAYSLLDDYFLLLYGDNYWPIDLNNMLQVFNNQEGRVLTTVFSNKDGTGEYGKENNIEVAPDCYVKRYDKKRKSDNLNGVDIGYFIVDKGVIDPDISKNISFEEDILPTLIMNRQLIAYTTDVQYYYITDIDSLKKFESAVIKDNLKGIFD